MSTTTSAISITPGEHINWHVFGLTLNGDTITSTLIAGAIIVLLGVLIARKSSVEKPTKLQLTFETIVDQVEAQVESSLGIRTAPWVVPFAVTLFVFILIANLIAIVPTGHHPEYAPPPASDVNLTYALALIVIGTMHVTGIRKNGFRGYYAHIVAKPRVMTPLRVIEEIMRPLTLALRLFGNIFAGTVMVALLAALPVYILWAPQILWKLFDSFIGIIQAFIFALLTIIYMGSVAPHEQEGAH
ncbi:F0F1 ATP synthase subunit A [uncultured Jatrophihabitans sp.]|uniref:F0F1 ATP synthase subunit A n=1 Tax=uncultured Jatrophihabitans sp. TaxID=1610747 RepID=UPI0035C948B2